MALILKKGECFLHIPKTGGSWVSEILKQQGLIKKEIGYHKHIDWTRVSYFPQSHTKLLSKINFSFSKFFYPKKSFCFVRHPLKWYESWWKYCCQDSVHWKIFGSNKYWHPNYFLHTCKSYDFNEFVRKVFDSRPGFVSEMYSQYAHNEIDFIGKQENLADDLIYFLMQQEYSIKIEDIQKSPRQNVSVAQKIKWDPQLREEVKDSEKMALLRYDYS